MARRHRKHRTHRAHRRHHVRHHKRSGRKNTPQTRKFKVAVHACWREGPTSAKALGKCMRRKLKGR